MGRSNIISNGFSVPPPVTRTVSVIKILPSSPKSDSSLLDDEESEQPLDLTTKSISSSSLSWSVVGGGGLDKNWKMSTNTKRDYRFHPYCHVAVQTEEMTIPIRSRSSSYSSSNTSLSSETTEVCTVKETKRRSLQSGSNPTRVKRFRTAFTPQQLAILEREFQRHHFVVGNNRKILASSLHLSMTQVKVWFQNRRIKDKKMKESYQRNGQEDEVTRKNDEEEEEEVNVWDDQ